MRVARLLFSKTLRQFQTDFATAEACQQLSDGVPLAGWVQLSAMRARKSV
jgi:hypothetical protein